MKITKTPIKDVLILEPAVFGDKRGFFMESFNQKVFNSAVGREVNFVQDNHSHSSQNILRGLHYQTDPMAQGKLVRVVQGEVLDVAVDLRKSSETFGHWTSTILSADNKKQFWIPEGFAHGFYVLSDTADFIYKATNYYSPEHDRSLLWNDKSIGVDWNLNKDPIISDKDSNACSFLDANYFE